MKIVLEIPVPPKVDTPAARHDYGQRLCDLVQTHLFWVYNMDAREDPTGAGVTFGVQLADGSWEGPDD